MRERERTLAVGTTMFPMMKKKKNMNKNEDERMMKKKMRQQAFFFLNNNTAHKHRFSNDAESAMNGASVRKAKIWNKQDNELKKMNHKQVLIYD